MKQMSDVETTTSSSPALNALLMRCPSRRMCESRSAFIIRGVTLQAGPGRVLAFYDRHPISEQQALAAVARRRGSADGPLSADDLFDYDQDHYGGLAAVDALARRASIGATTRVLDVCAGLGGPARFLA